MYPLKTNPQFAAFCLKPLTKKTAKLLGLLPSIKTARDWLDAVTCWRLPLHALVLLPTAKARLAV